MLYNILTPAQFVYVATVSNNFHLMLAQTSTGINTSAGFKQAIGKVLGDVIFPLLFLVGTLQAAYALYTSNRNENWKSGLTTAILLAGTGAIMTLAFYIFGLSGAAVSTDTSEVTAAGN